MSLRNIIVIGSANTDMVVKTRKLPLPGETIVGGSFFMNAGGKGANQAVAAARLGGTVTMVAKVGNDIFGKQTLENLQKENIHTGYIFVDEEAPSGTAVIMVNQDGENCIVVAPGANGNLLPADIKKVQNIDSAEIILLQLEIPMETVAAVIKIAKHADRKVILNPAPAQMLADELLGDLFLIIPNETEASILTGHLVVDEATAAAAATYFLKKGVKNVMITLGKNGAYFQNEHIHFRIPAPSVQAIDTTGAGDTFCGAIAVALSKNIDQTSLDWELALRFAIEAASLSVKKLGAQTSIPYRNEISITLGNSLNPTKCL